MTYEIYKISFNNEYERKEKISNVFEIHWKDDINEPYISFDFTTNEKLENNQWIELYEKDDKKVVFRGFIKYSSKTQMNRTTYYGYDLGYNLIKYSDTFDFKQACITNAIKEICRRFNIPVASDLKEDNTKFTHIYIKKTLQEVIFDILKGDNKINKYSNPVNKNYYIDCSSGYLTLKEYQKCEKLYGYIANLYRLDSLNTIKTFNITNTTDDKDKKEEDSITFLSDYNARKGIILPMKKEELNLDGNYLIKKTSHTIVSVKEDVIINFKVI